MEDLPRTPSKSLLRVSGEGGNGAASPESSLTGTPSKPPGLSLKELGRELQEQGRADAVLVSQLRQQVIWEELEILKRESAGKFSGIYALPSFHSIWDWHGVIFIRAGLYQHALFKFTIKVPTKYPLEAPKGVVNFQYLLMQDSNPNGHWDPTKHRLHTLIYLVKSLFYPNQKDIRVRDLAGDKSVNPFQLFNPNFQAGAACAAIIKNAVQNPDAVAVLTKNLRWWQENSEKVALVERKKNVSILSVTPDQLQVLRLADRDGAFQVEELYLAATDVSLNYRTHVAQCVAESQDKQEYNHGDFSIRMRNDLDNFLSSPIEGKFEGGVAGHMTELLHMAGISDPGPSASNSPYGTPLSAIRRQAHPRGGSPTVTRGWGDSPLKGNFPIQDSSEMEAAKSVIEASKVTDSGVVPLIDLS